MNTVGRINNQNKKNRSFCKCIMLHDIKNAIPVSRQVAKQIWSIPMFRKTVLTVAVKILFAKDTLQTISFDIGAHAGKPSNLQQEQFLIQKILVSEWIEYCLNIFRYISLNINSWNNRNAISTSKYWLKKFFLTLENTQNNVILIGIVYPWWNVLCTYDERPDAGWKLQYSVWSITQPDLYWRCHWQDKYHLLCRSFGKPSQKRSYENFQETYCNRLNIDLW